jgi:hypothetical protein
MPARKSISAKIKLIFVEEKINKNYNAETEQVPARIFIMKQHHITLFGN